ncbi:MAG TPA: tRNA dihydrouridine synthase DusB, partial [Steroidobacteraceae bacterium]|nr:tRNA dihydrouridine synthase DusB [Steroidobacteraceae bacterium]
ALAPMAGVTDRTLLQLGRAFGTGIAASEMLTSDARLWHTAKSRRRMDLEGEPEPRVVQIAGSDPQMRADAARMNVDAGAQIIDINMGCPAKKVCNKAAGSALLRDEDLVARILAAVVAAVDVPVTLKMRTGWSPEERNATRIACIAEQSGIQALAVHGRTRACRFQGPIDYDSITAVKAAVKIPVFANGDIDSAEKAQRILEQTRADGVMIGRCAQGRPWIFRQIVAFREGAVHSAEPSFAEVRDIMRAHLRNLHAFYGEEVGVRIARKHIDWYARDRGGAAALRLEVMQAQSVSVQIERLEAYFDALEAGMQYDNRCTGREAAGRADAERERWGVDRQPELASSPKPVRVR